MFLKKRICFDKLKVLTMILCSSPNTIQIRYVLLIAASICHLSMLIFTLYPKCLPKFLQDMETHVSDGRKMETVLTDMLRRTNQHSHFPQTQGFVD